MISHKLRLKVFKRDGEKCVACGRWTMLTIQHRVSKGMGGSKLFDTIPYLLTLCVSCNGRLESDFEFAELGRTNGWKLDRNQNPPVDPTAVPVNYFGQWYLLQKNGTKEKIKWQQD